MRTTRVWLAAVVVMITPATSFTEEPRRSIDRGRRDTAPSRVDTDDQDDPSRRTARHLAELHATLDRIERRRDALRNGRVDGQRTQPDERLPFATTRSASTASSPADPHSPSAASASAEVAFTHARGERVRVTARAGAPHADKLLPVVEATLTRIAADWCRDASSTLPEVAVHIDWHERATRGATAPPLRSDSPYRVWITAPDVETLERSLAHELTHVVLLSRFGESLPAWANEGIASLEDDSARVQLRRQIVARWIKTGGFPDLGTVLARDVIEANDLETYAAATTLIEFLLARTSRDEAAAALDELARANGVKAQAAALGHRDVASLESAWRHWVTNRESERRAGTLPAAQRLPFARVAAPRVLNRD